MNDLAKLKKERAILRTVVTKYINKIESENLENSSETSLEEFILYLEQMSKELKALDNEIKKLINEDKDFENEIQSAIEYNQKITSWISKFNAIIKVKNYS